MGEASEVIKFFYQALVIDREIGNRRGESYDLIMLGQVHYNLGEFQKAIEFFDAALAIDREIGNREDERYDLSMLGQANHDFGEFQKAIEFHEQALIIDREIGDRHAEGEALGNLGWTYAILGEYQKAMAYIEQLIELAKEQEDHVFFFGMGLIYSSVDQEEKAIQAYSKAIQLTPKNPVLYRNRASCLIKLQKWPEASSDITEAENLSPTTPTSLSVKPTWPSGRDNSPMQSIGTSKPSPKKALQKIPSTYAWHYLAWETPPRRKQNSTSLSAAPKAQILKTTSKNWNEQNPSSPSHPGRNNDLVPREKSTPTNTPIDPNSSP